MQHEFINKLQPGKMINDVYMVSQPVLRNTTRGDYYIAMFLSDKTGKANCRVWQASEDLFRQIPSEGFVRINGKTELYQGSMQIVANEVVVMNPEEVNLEDYLPRTKYDIDVMFKELLGILGEIKNPQVKAIVDEFVADAELMTKFQKAPAAVKMHHNYLGGLLEHTLSMIKAAWRLLPLYPDVNGDLVLAGIFLHDMAKTEELSYGLAFSYTDPGQLLGHIVLGTIMLDQKVDMLMSRGVEIDSDISNRIAHILVSHHGKYEFGSPKLPATPEAIMVSYIDDLDAKLNFIQDAIESDPSEDDWTGWKPSNVTVGTKYYKKRI